MYRQNAEWCSWAALFSWHMMILSLSDNLISKANTIGLMEWLRNETLQLIFLWEQRNTDHAKDQYAFIQISRWFSQPQGCIIQWMKLIGWVNQHHDANLWPPYWSVLFPACLSASDAGDTLYTVQVAGHQVNLIPCNYGGGRSCCNLSDRRMLSLPAWCQGPFDQNVHKWANLN